MGTLRIGMAVSLTLCAGLLPTALVGATEGAGEQGLAKQLRESLTAQGWTPLEAADGSIGFIPPLLMQGPVAAEPSPASEVQTAGPAVDSDAGHRPPGVAPQQTAAGRKSPAENLRETLESQGWAVAPAEDGGIYYFPPERDPSETSLAERLKSSLEQQGWVGSTAEDGSVVYRKPEPEPSADGQDVQEPPTAEQQTPAEQLRQSLRGRGWTAVPAEDGGHYYLPPEREQTAQPELAERLKAALEQRGWASSEAEDGSLIYRSPESSANVEASEAAGFADHFIQRLERRGWQARTEDDGSVTLFKPQPQPQREEPEDEKDEKELGTPPPLPREESRSDRPAAEPVAPAERSTQGVPTRRPGPARYWRKPSHNMPHGGYPSHRYNAWGRPPGQYSQRFAPAPGWSAPQQWQRAPRRGQGQSNWDRQQPRPYWSR